MQVGRYSGVAVDKLPNSYLRWLIAQDFSKLIVDAAKQKLDESEHSDLFINVSRHTVDMFSKRFLGLWVNSEADKGEDAVGLGTFIATLAQQAWEHGEDISKHRHQDDGTVKLYKDIKWVFNVGLNYPDYKDVITVMPGTDL